MPSHSNAVYWYKSKTPRVEALSGTVSNDVVVVGGGIAGLTCADTLMKSGRKVTLLERAFCGAGASGKTSGFITPDSELSLSDLVAGYGATRGRSLWEFARSGVERIRATIESQQIECDYQVQDSVFVARSNRAFRRVIEPEHRVHTSLGYHTDLYGREALRAIVGSSSFEGGIRYGSTFGINSYAYCRALRDAIERRGVKIFEGTAALRLSERGVETPQGLAAGAAVAVLTDSALPALGLAEASVYQVQAFLAISQPLREQDIRTIFPSGNLMVWDTDLLYQYFRMTGESRLLCGGGDLRSAYSRDGHHSSRRMARKLQRYLAHHFPSVRIDFESIWSGFIGVTKDFAPVVGQHGALRGVYFAGAGAGLPWSAALGEYVAQKIATGRNEFDAVFSPTRPFVVGTGLQRLIGKPAAFALSHAAKKYAS